MKHPKPTIVELLAELGIPRNDATMQPILDRIEAAYEEANTGLEWCESRSGMGTVCMKEPPHEGELHEDAEGNRWAS